MAKKKMTEKELMNEIKDLFDFFDANGDKLISRKELELGLRTVGNPTITEIDNLLKEMGVTETKKGQKGITLEQFQKSAVKYFKNELNEDAEEERLKKAFKIFDKNGDGTVDKVELKQVLTSIGDKLTDAEVDQMFREADLDRDGKIKYEEFTKMMVN